MRNHFDSHNNNTEHKSMHFFMGKRGGAFGSISDLELQRSFGPGQDPRPPKPEPGDKYIMLGVIIGLILGGVLGGIVGSLYNLYIVTVIFCIFGGVLVGGLSGTVIGILIKKHVLKKKPESK